MSVVSHAPTKRLKQDLQSSTETLVAYSRTWIEECTGCSHGEKKHFREFLQDGVVLCELMQTLVPGEIRRINRLKNPFAWRENISLFLGACSKLGLRESQLFITEDLITATNSYSASQHRTKSDLPGSEKSLRAVALTVYYLALELQSQEGYSGPHIQRATGIPQPLKLPPSKDKDLSNHVDHYSPISPDRSSLITNSTSSPSSSVPSPSTSKTSSIPSLKANSIPSPSNSSLPSPSGSKTRRVESVTNLITETSSTDIQAYAELVLYLNGSNKEFRRVSKPPPIRLTQSFNRPSTYANRAASRVHRTLSDRTPLSTAPRVPLSESVSDYNIPTLNSNGAQEFISEENGRGSSVDEYPDYRDFDSVTTPSDASTVIFREFLSSRCSSNLPATSEDFKGSLCGSYNNSPITTRHRVSTSDQEEVTKPPSSIPGDIPTALSDCKSAALESEEPDLKSEEAASKEVPSPLADSSEDFESALSVSANLNFPSSTKELTSISEERDRHSSPLSSDHSSVHKESTLADSSQPQTQSTTEQVTDIYSPKLNHVPSPESAKSVEIEFDGDGSFDSPLENSSKVEMDGSVNYQLSSNHVEDSDLSLMNGIKTNGYTSNGISKPIMTSNAEVPHHSLTLASSDPESPSPCQVADESRDFSSHHQNFEVSSLNKNFPPIRGVDMSRVQSDALPYSLLPSKVICENGSVGDNDPKAGLPKMLADAQSIDTNSVEDIDQFSTSESLTRRSVSPQQLLDTLNESTDDLTATVREQRELSPVGAANTSSGEGRERGSIAAPGPPPASSASSHSRPSSAPNRSVSVGVVSHHQQAGSLGGVGSDWLKEKRQFVDVERQKRLVNIQEGARAAQQYSAKRKTSRSSAENSPLTTVSPKSETLPRESRSHSIISATSSNDDMAVSSTHSLSNYRKSLSPPPVTSSPAADSASSSLLHHHQESSLSSTSDAMPLNLRHLSIDQTKEASMNQMDEIWRQVEAIGDFTPSSRSMGPSYRAHIFSDTNDTDGGRGGESDNLDPKDGGMESTMPLESKKLPEESSSTPEVATAQERRRSDIVKESDVLISILEPMSRSTPLREPLLDVGMANGSEGVTSGLSVGGVVGDLSTLGASLLEPPRERNNKRSSFSNQDIDSLLDTLKSLNNNEEDEDLKILEDMLKSTTFKKAKHVHDDMRQLLTGTPAPAKHRVLPSTQLMRQHLHHHTEQSADVEELRELLRAPHIQAVLFCHDKVATQDLYVPDAKFHRTAHDPVDIILSASVDNFQAFAPDSGGHASNYDPVSAREVPFNRKEGATIVFLERTNRPLGCTIYKQEDSVFIGKLLKGCDAEASDMLREGDELLEVNGTSVMGKRTDEIIRLMSGDVQPGTTLSFTIIPVHDESYDIDYEPKYMRAHFGYDGSLDDEIPCKALGLSFQKGDIMEIVNMDEPDWWQACKVFDESAVSLPGLIPSMHLQQQREALIHSYAYSNTSTETKKGLRGIFSRKKKKKVYYQNTTPSNVLGIGDEIPTYEQVIRLDPDPSLCRPIILIGAPGVGRKTLIRKLLNSDPLLYQPVVQHTSRLVRPGEVAGHDYHFVTKEEFERDVEQDRFLEYGEVKGHYYGTSFSTIKSIMESGRVPVLDLHPQALKKIRHSGLKPYIVFVASPRFERLLLTRKVGTEKLKRRLSSSPHHTVTDHAQVYTEADLQHLVQESRLIEKQYGHYFDWIIVNDDFQVASDMLKEVCRRLESEQQWVPYAWKNF